MKYVDGYIAFIDILGFSQLVSDETNGENIKKLFQFIEKYCYLYNTSPELSQNVAFFSDSIVLASNDIYMLNTSIQIAESYLKSELGLVFRGGITYGKYYYEKGVVFGPAVIRAYNLEKIANYSRILIDNNVEAPEKSELLIYQDMDGWRVLNPYSMVLQSGCSYGSSKRVTYPEDPTANLKHTFEECRKVIIDKIKQYKNTSVVDKYLWRIRPFNYTCRVLLACSDEELLYPEINYSMNSELRDILSQSIIGEDYM